MPATTVQYALMAGAAYFSTPHEDNRLPYPDGWLPLDEAAHLDHRLDPASGFEAVAFINQATHEIVISFAGMNGLKDIRGDWIQGNMTNATGLPSAQLLLAARYYQDIKRLYGTYAISFTGHSLGGGLASLMGVFFNRPAVTFDQAPFANWATAATGMPWDVRSERPLSRARTSPRSRAVQHCGTGLVTAIDIPHWTIPVDSAAWCAIPKADAVGAAAPARLTTLVVGLARGASLKAGRFPPAD